MKQQQEFFGLLYIILGTIIFILAAGILIVRLLFAALGIWFIIHGFKLKTGWPLNVLFWSWRR